MKLGVMIIAGLFLAGCVSSPKPPDLKAIHNEAAMRHGPETNPIIVIPGVFGLRLLDEPSGTLVWGAFDRKVANPRNPDEARLMALPMVEGHSLAESRDGAGADGTLDTLKISLFPGVSVEPKAYMNIPLTLGAGGYADHLLGEAGAVDSGSDHYICYQFSYDWRGSSVENAALLHDFIAEKKKFVEKKNRERFGRMGNVKFDIVAHSMSGLMARHSAVMDERYGTGALGNDLIRRLPGMT